MRARDKSARPEDESARKELGRLLQAGRTALGPDFKQRAIAKQVQKSISTISRLEAGDEDLYRTVTEETLTRVYQAVAEGLEAAGIDLNQPIELAARLGITIRPILGSTALPQPTAAPSAQGIDARWDRLHALSHQLNLSNQWDQALPDAAGATAEARTGEEQAAALIEAAHAYWHLGSHSAAFSACLDALNALGLDTLEPESGEVPPRLSVKLSEHGLRLCSEAARLMGEVYLRKAQLDDAEGCFRFSGHLGELLGDREIRAEAVHWQMRTLLERGTVPALDGEWRIVRDRATVEKGLACLQEAWRQNLLPPTEGDLAQDLRWRGRGLYVLGNLHDAEQERRRAEALFSQGPYTVHLHHVSFDHGVTAIAAGALVPARDHLNRTLDQAARIKYPKTVSDALGSLSYVDGVSLSTSDRERALNSAVASLLAYPDYLGTPEGELILRWCVDLADALAGQPTGSTRQRAFWTGRREAIVEAIAIGRSPVYLVRGLHTTSEVAINAVLTALDKRMHAEAPS